MNYWQLLDSARRALADGRFRAAEETFEAAAAARRNDARRIFLSEALPDGIGRLWRFIWRRDGGRDSGKTADPGAGRWERAVSRFGEAFRSRSEALMLETERQLQSGVAADPGKAADTLAAAMYLAVASRLVTRRLPAARILKELFELLPHSGRLCDPDLVVGRLPLTASVRLDLAERALPHLVQLPRQQRGAWVQTILALLDDPSVDWLPGSGPRRRWLAACLADRYAETAAEVVERWCSCDEPQQPEPNRRWSRLRRLEVQAGRDPRRLAVPCYAEAHRLAAALTPAADAEEQARCREAMSVVAYRRPGVQPSRAWISAGRAADDSVLAVFWWGDEPRDVARWHPADAPEVIGEFFEAAEGRILWEGNTPPQETLSTLDKNITGMALQPYLETVLEPAVQAGGWSDSLARGLALSRCGSWRSGWRADRGHPLLAPPGQDGQLAPAQAEIEPILHAGLLWLAVLQRINSADPALRAGLAELGRLGDPAAAFLHEHAVLGDPARAAVDAGFAAWTLPLLWTRRDPLASGASESDDASAEHSDLAGHDVAVVATGRPANVLWAWGHAVRRWRVVLDRWDRLSAFMRLIRASYGPVTVVPCGGLVHELQPALDRLALFAAAASSAPFEDQMLAVCHWIRLVESHNGDLFDAHVLRPRNPGVCPWLDRYVERVADLPRQPLPAGLDADDRGWAAQFVQRARRSGLVIGLVDDLAANAAELDAAWGVYDGSDASWVFLDSAAVHWRLHERGTDRLRPLHDLLASRGGRHLSILGDRGVYGEDLADWFDGVLCSYGKPYHRDMQDGRPPRLRLAGRGPLPGSCLAPAAAGAAALRYLGNADTLTSLHLTERSADAPFWKAAASGEFGPVPWILSQQGASRRGRRLVVPRWESLADIAVHVLPEADSVDAWRHADGTRRELLAGLKRLLALECAALLASDADEVEVLDGRWWRFFGQLDRIPDATTAEAGRFEIIDLNEQCHTDAYRRLQSAITAWLAERGRLAGLVPGWTGLPLADGQFLAPAGVFHHLACAAALWRDLAAELLSRWERGDPVGRQLIVAEKPPAGAGALASMCAGPGATVLQADSAEPDWGTVVWARPADLLACLSSGFHLPAFERVLLLDAERHRPPSPRAVEGGRLLAGLVRGSAARLDLVGDPCREPWSSFFALQLGMQRSKDPEPGQWLTLRRGEVPQTARRCPHCAEEAQESPDALFCCHCSYDLAGPGPRPEEVATTADRVRRLVAQTDLGREHLLEIWTEPAEAPTVRHVLLQQGAKPDSSDPDTWVVPAGRRWRLRDLSGSVAAAAGPAVLLQPPCERTSLRPWAARGNQSSLTLFYDRFEILRARDRSATAETMRFLRLLSQPAWMTEPMMPQAGLPALQYPARTLPLWALAWLTGRSVRAVRRDLDVLRWAAAVTDRPDVDSGADLAGVRPTQAADPRWLVHVSLRDAQQQLDFLAGQLETLLAGWLADGLAGAWQLQNAPAGPGIQDPVDASGRRVSPMEAVPAGIPFGPTDGVHAGARLDMLLALLAATRQVSGSRLVYAAPEGAWFSSRRAVGWLGDRDRLVASLRQRIADLASPMQAVMAGGSHVDTGFYIDADREPQALAEPGILLPQLLGFWSRHGRSSRDEISISELEYLMQSNALSIGSPGPELLLALADERDRWRAALEKTPAGGRISTLQPVLAEKVGGKLQEPRRWFRGKSLDAERPVRHEVAGWLSRPPPSRLVLAGPYGSGRSASVLAALAAGASSRQAAIWCPDEATAVRLHLAARKLDPGWQPVIHVQASGETLPDRTRTAPGERSIVVMAELQRWPRDVSYELQERARGGHLLLCVDTADMPPATAWEDLFLTTPSRHEVRRLQVQVLQASQLWRVTGPFLASRRAERRSRRRDRGVVTARPARTLEECAAAVAAASAENHLGRTVNLVLPLPEDMPLLSSAMSDRGWVAVRERDLQPLLLPGTMEMFAALADAHRRLHGAWPGLATEASTAGMPPILSGFLTPGQAIEYAAWLQGLSKDVLGTVSVFLSHLRRSPWGLLCCGQSTARRKMVALMNEASAAADLLAPPLWEAWRRRVDAILGRRAPGVESKVACLAAAAEAIGEPVESLAYICFGPEPAPVHRRVLLRATDRLLVLYQEHSPLPDQWEA